jgi:hypothetical protein
MQLRSQPVQLRQVAQHASAHVAIQAAVQASGVSNWIASDYASTRVAFLLEQHFIRAAFLLDRAVRNPADIGVSIMAWCKTVRGVLGSCRFRPIRPDAIVHLLLIGS